MVQATANITIPLCRGSGPSFCSPKSFKYHALGDTPGLCSNRLSQRCVCTDYACVGWQLLRSEKSISFMSRKGAEGRSSRLGSPGRLVVRMAALVILLSFVLVPMAGAAQETPPSEKPNIVFILTDDLDTYTLTQLETTRT